MEHPEIDDNVPANDAETQRKLIHQAITRYLAQREHGFNEIIYKLVQKGFTQSLCEELLQTYRERDWQSDYRYANSLIKRRIDKGYGLQYIQGECRNKGLGSADVQLVLEELETDWYALAKDVAERKFAGRPVKDQKDYLKRCNFLRNRGFGLSEIKYAIDGE